MEVTALCFRLLINVSMLTQIQLCFSQKAVYPHVVPNRQQFFEYESVVVSCEGLDGLTGWRVMKEIMAHVTICSFNWESSTGPCTITPVLTLDSGTYWCLAGQKRSNTINITITAGSVILESPALPVTEGEAVTLSCRQKISSDLSADFYKDGILVKSNSTGKMTLHPVSKSHEGLYKCSISQSEESAESWLAVRDNNGTTSTVVCCSLGTSLQIFGIIIILLVLGLVVGVGYWRK